MYHIYDSSNKTIEQLILYLYIDVPSNKWDLIMKENGLNMVDLRDNRYNQIIHMVSAACGAEDFYTTEVNKTTNRINTSVIKLTSRFFRII